MLQANIFFLITSMTFFTYFYLSSAFISFVYVFSPRISLSEYSLLFNVVSQIFEIAGILLFYPASGLFVKMLRSKLSLRVCAALLALLLWTASTASNVLLAGILFCLFMGASFFCLSFCFYCVALFLPTHQRGKSIAAAYAASALCTAVLGLIPGAAGLRPPVSLTLYTVCILAGFILYSEMAGADFAVCSNESGKDRPNFSQHRVLFAGLFSFALLLAILYGVSSQFVASYAYRGINVAAARGFTALGFLAAGYLGDKNRKYAFFASLAAISFTFLLLALYRSPETAFFAASCTYILTGIYVIYPLTIFTDFAADAPPALVSGLGVLSLRLGVMISYLMTNWFILKNPVADALFITVLFVLLLLSAAYLYEKLYPRWEVREKVVEVRVKEYFSPVGMESAQKEFGLSGREKEVLTLILTGLTAKEAAQKLFITERTVKAHLSAIYRKTGTKNRVELSRIISDQDAAPALEMES